MGKFVKGDVIVVSFPFSDLSASKRRPALVLAELDGEDIILCQITSKQNKDCYSINLENNDFVFGSLKLSSNIRANRIFTADKKIILYKIGTISDQKMDEVKKMIIRIFT
jgi:mRNA interferase MazF